MRGWQFIEAVARDETKGGRLCGHNGCTNPLGPRVNGEHNKIKGIDVCEDCYYASVGAEIEARPIGRRRPRGTSATD